MGCLCSKATEEDTTSRLDAPLIKEVDTSPSSKSLFRLSTPANLPETSHSPNNKAITPPAPRLGIDSISSVPELPVKNSTAGNAPLTDITNGVTTEEGQGPSPSKGRKAIPMDGTGTFVFNTNHAFKKVQKHKKGTTRHTLHKQLQSMLSSGNVEMFDIVKLPAGQNVKEWLAVHTVDFFNEVALLYGVIVDECTSESCPAMTAGRATYLWADGKSVKKPQKVPAHEYVDYLMTWIEEQIAGDELFSTSTSGEISGEVKAVFKRLFRVYAHLYHKHFDHFTEVNAETHLNTCFERYIYFCLEFDLVEEKELEPLRELVDRFKLKRDQKIESEK